jgi:hypothetical protein
VLLAGALAGVFAGAFAFGVTAFGATVFGFLAVALLSSSFAFLFGPGAEVFFVSVFTGVTCAAGLLAAPFFASRSFFVHSFFNFVSSLLTLAGTLRFPAFTASNSRMRATDLVLDGGRP